jgi:hypothetical protein
MILEAITTAEIASVLGVVNRTIQRRAKKEKWRYTTGKNRTKHFNVVDLPFDIQKQMAEKTRFTGMISNKTSLTIKAELSKMVLYRKKHNESLKRVRLLLDRLERL